MADLIINAGAESFSGVLGISRSRADEIFILVIRNTERGHYIGNLHYLRTTFSGNELLYGFYVLGWYYQGLP